MASVQDVSRPKKDGVTRRVWEIADEITADLGREATRALVTNRAIAEGVDPGTANKQYYDWRKSSRSRAVELFSGVSEAPALPLNVALQIGADGRVLIPVELRRQMKIGDNGRLTARIVDGELRLISPLAALDQFHRYIQDHDLGEGSVVDELIADRRAEAARE